MKINHITVKHVLGALFVDLPLKSAISLIAGTNGSGKSSIQNAIRMALIGELSRISLKKHLKQLVTEGQKTGRADVFINGVDHSYNMNLPGGDGPHNGDCLALPYVLTPAMFATKSPDDRRRFLFELADIKASTDHVRERLKARDVNITLAEQVIALLRSGFPAAATEAARRATESKGSWKAITGETWGSKKAEGWERPIPAEAGDQDAIARVTDQVIKIQQELAAANQSLGGLRERDRQYSQEQTHLEQLKAQAELLPVCEENHKNAIAERDYQQELVDGVATRAGAAPEFEPQNCPHCEGLLQLVNGQILPADCAAEVDQEAIDLLPSAQQKLMTLTAAASTAHDAMDRARRSADDLASRTIIEPVDQGDIEKLNGTSAALTAQLQEQNSSLDDLKDAQFAADQAKQDTKQAGIYHKQVGEWLAIATAFSPEGIPGEFLDGALVPINQRLAASSAATGWPCINIDREMGITARNRPYELLSESEQWRANTQIAEAISLVSGLNLIMLDRIDVLDIPSRGKLLGWLEGLAAAGEIETALLFGTLKSADYQSEHTRSHWIEQGQLSNIQEAA